MTNPSDKHDLPHDGNAHAPLPDSLRWQLRALRREQEPVRDLWPGIAARLPPRDAIVTPPHRPARWLAPVAMAASLLLVVGVLGWNTPLKPTDSPPQPVATPALAGADTGADAAPDTATTRTPSMLALETAGMARQYQAAFDQIGAVPAGSGLHPALAELDRNAELILQALSEQPDSRLLLERLHRTYARRLALSQRLVHS